MAAVRALARPGIRAHRAVVAFGLAIGLPLGVALGRVAYNAFARSIGATPEPFIPPVQLSGLVVVVFALGLVAAALSGRWVSSHATVSEALRANGTDAPA